MVAEKVRAAHIEADKHNLPRTHQKRQIDRLKA